MSLQLLAKQMEAKGRKGDSMLVHMTAKEVAALQKMAESAGGSLSVNPETGLVEANFLKRMLPTLVGVGVGMFAGPMAGAAAGAAVGGATAPKDQREMGMLMGALGGYGGAGIGAGLGTAGSTAAQATAMGAEATRQGAQQALAQTAQQTAMAEGAKLAGAEAAQTTAQQLAAEKLAQEAAADMARREAGAAAIKQAGETAAKDFTSQGFAARAGQGIQALAGQPGRDAFFGQVGMKTAGMAAAPLMIEDRRQAEVPVDDEMYSYTFDPGRTNVERTPTDSTAERRYFDSSFSPMRRIRASEYGFAEGGEAAAPAMNASDAAYAYLMGDSPSSTGAPNASQAGLSYLMGERSSSAPVRGPSFTDGQTSFAPAASRAPVVGGDNMYAFDPATGTFLRNPNIPGASTSGSPVGTSFSGSGGSDNVPMSQQTKDFFDRETPAQRDARMGEFQNLFNLGPTGAFISALRGDEARAPNFGTLFGTGDAYKNIGYDYNQAGGYDPSSGQSYAESVGMGGDYGYSGYSSGEDRGEAAGGLITLADGGLMGLAKGGMKSGGFVIPADVVSMVGEGNTDAGYSRITSMVPGATAIKGKDGGQADTVKTSIEGKQPARVAHGEMYIPPETVKRMGGAKKLYAMMDRVREQATGSKKQIKPVSLKQAMA
jgi:hypothetical protein